ncbi:XRE family transcriptional regulator [Persephonella sp.]|uniref:LexA family protein n=1 Tax=Persephonella sp. TaxID=2060922 RepID=UPI0026375244|nr:XRE family transcriptional regulator [Persephonella sp.]
MELDINRREIQDKIREKVKALMQERGLKQKDLVEKSGLSQVFISYFLTGKRNIGFNALEKIAQALGVSVAELLSSPEEKRSKLEEVEEITDVVLLPVVADVPAGGFESGDVEIEDYLPAPKSMLAGVPKEFAAWWKVSGTSMSPEINPGDLVLVAYGGFVDIKNGDRVIAVINGERTLKRFYDKGEYIILQPVNDKDHEPIIIKKDQLKESPIYLYKVLGVFKRY